MVVIEVRSRRFQNDVRDLFSGAECHGESFQALVKALTAVNAGCRDYTFGVDSASKLLVRGQEVWIVLGRVGSISSGRYGTGGWGGQQTLYALANCQNQTEWMASNADIFSPIRAAVLCFPVFWVKLSILKAGNSVSLAEKN